jgi:hypothetical protein
VGELERRIYIYFYPMDISIHGFLGWAIASVVGGTLLLYIVSGAIVCFQFTFFWIWDKALPMSKFLRLFYYFIQMGGLKRRSFDEVMKTTLRIQELHEKGEKENQELLEKASLWKDELHTIAKYVDNIDDAKSRAEKALSTVL